MNKYLIGIIIGMFAISVGLLIVNQQSKNVGGGNSGITAAKCDVSTVTMATVGDDLSSTILATAGNRAWAKLELVQTNAGVATNTPSLSFDEGSAATLASGLKLSTSTPSIVFGRNTDFPYVGEVTGITDQGSTTIRVTQCLY